MRTEFLILADVAVRLCLITSIQKSTVSGDMTAIFVDGGDYIYTKVPLEKVLEELARCEA